MKKSILATLSFVLAFTSSVRAGNYTAEEVLQQMQSAPTETLLADAQKRFGELSVEKKRQLILDLDAMIAAKISEVERLSKSPLAKTVDTYGAAVSFLTLCAAIPTILAPWAAVANLSKNIRWMQQVVQQSESMQFVLHDIAREKAILGRARAVAQRNTFLLAWAAVAGVTATLAFTPHEIGDSEKLQASVLKGQIEPLKLLATGFRAQLRALLLQYLKETEPKS